MFYADLVYGLKMLVAGLVFCGVVILISLLAGKPEDQRESQEVIHE